MHHQTTRNFPLKVDHKINLNSMSKKTTEEFIKDARKKHGNKYDYSKVVYVNNRTKVCIICPEHGEFWQVPFSHLQGQGCPKCRNEATGERFRSSKEDFIKKAREKHGDKYDYSKVDYVGVLKKVCIICPKHGEFWQEANNHLRGQGCPKCNGDKIRERQILSKEGFIKKARLVHGNKYDYSKVNYANNATKLCIICPKHGEFWQTPNGHLSGQGCPKCGLENSREKQASTKEEFIKKAREKHGDKYDYSKVEYINANTKVCIICPQHGEFWQRPNSHLSGHGCHKCKRNQLSCTE